MMPLYYCYCYNNESGYMLVLFIITICRIESTFIISKDYLIKLDTLLYNAIIDQTVKDMHSLSKT